MASQVEDNATDSDRNSIPPRPDEKRLLPPADPRAADLAATDLPSAVSALRVEIEQLREEQRKLLEHTKDNKDGDQKPKSDDKGSDRGKGDDKNNRDDRGEDKNADKEEDKEQEKKPPLRERAIVWGKTHPLAVVAIIIGLVILVICGIWLWNYLQSYESTDDAQIDGHTMPISSRIAGTVVKVDVEDTQYVAAGQTLIELDSRDYQVSLSAAKASLAQAVANRAAQQPNIPITQTSEATSVSVAQFDVSGAEATLGQAQHNYQSAIADLQQAEAQSANAAAEEVRYRELVDKEEVSREQYDQRATAARAAAAVVDARKAAVETARKVVDQRQAELEQARTRAQEAAQNRPQHIAIQRSTVAARDAEVQAAQAQVAQSSLNLSYVNIPSPTNGIVGNRNVEVGTQIAPGQELMAITPLEDLWVTANFKETQTLRLRPGQGVTIRVDALAANFDGFVENLPGATGAKYSLLPPENATGNYVKVVQRLPVRIRFKTGQDTSRLRPGMSVEPKVWVK